MKNQQTLVLTKPEVLEMRMRFKSLVQEIRT